LAFPIGEEEYSRPLKDSFPTGITIEGEWHNRTYFIPKNFRNEIIKIGESEWI
jgi:hypothetical protein